MELRVDQIYWGGPKVYVLAKSEFCVLSYDDFLEQQGVEVPACDSWECDPEHLIEAAGRICYMSYGKGRKSRQEYIDNILKSKHGSVLEHASVSFIIEGISRSLSHEMVRHRAGFAFSQLSQRYVDESDVRYVVPPYLKKISNTEKFDKWLLGTAASHKTYTELIKSLMLSAKADYPTLSKTDQIKIARQTARSVLPNCTETKMVVTANCRAWRHFLEMRGSIHADTEIRQLAIEIFKELINVAPNVFQDMILTQEYGIDVIKVEYSKV